jgi:hypothetical protein
MYKSKGVSGCCLANSEECLLFNNIEPYKPDKSNPLVILNTLPYNNCRQFGPTIYRVDDIFLELITDSNHYYSFKERQAINPKCGQLTKAAIRDQSTATADFVKDPVDAPIS